MEADVFPKPAVAGLLQKGFVELRMHVENQQKDGRWEKFVAFREEIIAGDQTQPTYIVLDPNSRETLDGYQLRGTKVEGWHDDILKMLTETYSQAHKGE